ncbi:hypothetical protein pdam_00021904 [Pocillopora damicornis]|uniref:Uncharacterized protein n=1 Tax=Pocillopora damicornis TaxID=46731 RepID=A0A3M6TN84_POCDA|nr:hypothetical protein pdam_00021904 [Pocillopora damicornis]
MALYEYLDPGVNGKNMKYWLSSQDDSQTAAAGNSVKHGRLRTVTPSEEYFLSKNTRQKSMSFSFDGAYLIRSWKLYKAVQAFQLWRKPIFFRNESKFLQQPRHEQEQLDFSQWFASTEPSARSEWEIVTLAGDQVSFVVKVTVRVELSRVLPAFGIQVN